MIMKIPRRSILAAFLAADERVVAAETICAMAMRVYYEKGQPEALRQKVVAYFEALELERKQHAFLLQKFGV